MYYNKQKHVRFSIRITSQTDLSGSVSDRENSPFAFSDETPHTRTLCNRSSRQNPCQLGTSLQVLVMNLTPYKVVDFLCAVYIIVHTCIDEALPPAVPSFK